MRVSEIFGFEKRTKQEIPLFLANIKAGFPSPADDYVDMKLDLNEFIVKHPAATFFVRVEGESMINAGIFSGDILVVDRALEPADKKIVIAHINGELTVKRIRMNGNEIFLVPENPEFEPIKVGREDGLGIWGVVTYVLHPV
jgi:DNA polymerase V